ncbi:MAG: VWA domain-containing protein [Rhodobacter sp.]|nr:VWA domain-containing protein [Rhodobacter sp.]
MTDDLSDLRAALKSVPEAGADAKARALALAMENFDRLQGSTDTARSSEDRPQRVAPLNGVRRMLNLLTSRPALATTTSIAALVIGVAVILPVADLRSPIPAEAPALKAAPKPESPAATLDSADAPADLARKAETDLSASVVVAETAAETVVGAEPAPELMAEMPELAEVAPPAPAGAIADMELRLQTEAVPEGGTLGYIALDPVLAPLPDVRQPELQENTEAYANEPANPVKVTAEEPVSTFSIDVDTASWAVIRSTLNMAVLPTPDQVRVEEMVNYFPYAYPAATAEQAFSSSISIMPTPWNPGTRLVTIGIQGALPEVEARPALNLVFLIDTSGSMEDANKLGLLKQSLSLMLSELRPEDQIAIVTYAGSAGQVLPPTAAADRATILAALENLAAGGSTAGAEGLELAYQVAEGMKADNEVTRILLATDGDFNVGVSDPEGLEVYVGKMRETGTYLSVLGFGRGNLDDAVMQSLAQNGNGTAAYIDTLSEARKVLVDQLTGALFPIADDVKIQVEWNPATVAEYRLIGYETRALRREDFNNDKVDAGEIGAGTQVTAIYEVTAPGSDALLNDPLRYGTATTTEAADAELGFLRLRWKAPGEDNSTLIETPITGREAATGEARFAAAIAGFGQLLQGSVYLGDWGWDQAIELALSSRGEDAFGYRIEAVNLMRLAQSLAAN